MVNKWKSTSPREGLQKEWDRRSEGFGKRCQNNSVKLKVTPNNSPKPTNTILEEDQKSRVSLPSNNEIKQLEKMSKSNDKETNEYLSVEASEGSQVAARKRAGRKRENLGLTQRKDVVLKTLLRKMRTSLWEEFNSFTRFKHKRNKTGPLQYDIWLDIFAREKLGVLANAAYLFYLSILMSTRQTEEVVSFKHSSIYKQSDEERAQQFDEIKQVHEVLYKFSYSKFKRLLKKQELWSLIHDYFAKLDQAELSQDKKIGSEILLKDWRASLNL